MAVAPPFHHRVQEVEHLLNRCGLGAFPIDAKRRPGSEQHGLIGIVIHFEALGCADSLLAISERIDMARGRDPRREYSYHLLGPGPGRRDRIWGWDRDLKKDPPMRDHYHPPGGGRVAGTVQLHQVLEQAWEAVQSAPIIQTFEGMGEPPDRP